MKRDLALRVLGKVMNWDDERALAEFRWLSLISRLKYDAYSDFVAGVRFIESLAGWLQQFDEVKERELAYSFVRSLLVYVGPAEIHRLVELSFSNTVEPRLLKAVAEQQKVPTYRVWADKKASAEFDRLLRASLFIGLSEGARLDHFRRVNSGVISNEQILLATYINRDKWDKVLSDLCSDLSDDSAKFRFVFLIDDFTASGTTFVRKRNGAWKGKLAFFRDTVDRVLATHFDPDLVVCVHHYIASSQASEELSKRQAEALADRGPEEWFSNVEFSFGITLPDTMPLDRSPIDLAEDFLNLAKDYCDRDDPLFNNRHFREGGTNDPALGFADCALPLVLEHNTPNNSVALLWAETPSRIRDELPAGHHPMRPLFRRRQRHV